MTTDIIRGRVHKFGDNINTDAINPAKYMELSINDMIAHVMEGADPNFAKNVKPGDIMVAGKNFGSGSSRETSPTSIKGTGVSVVIAEFFARIFYRNAINVGLKVLICKQASEISAGDELEVAPSTGRILNLTTGKEYLCDPLPNHILELVKDGGLISHLEKKLAAGN
jgi:3-isopropylmalate/(R)-2-methylmalate dehydratase small subunit